MRVAVIGAGRMGQRHIQVVQGMGLDLVGVSDQSPETLRLIQTTLGVAPERLFTDSQAMLNSVRAECVVVATTAPSHAALTLAAVSTGATHILCEKPMATSILECDHMIAATSSAGVRLAINHQMRFMEQYTKPKAIVDSEAFGGLSAVVVVAGNIGMAMNGSHYFEMLRYMTGEPVDSVTAWLSDPGGPNPRGSQYQDRAGSIRATTASGKRLYLEIGADQGQGIQVVYSGRYGQLVVNELAGTYYLMERQKENRSLPTTRYGAAWGEKQEHIAPADALAPTRSVLEALLGNRPIPMGEDGRRAIEALVAAYVSDETGNRTVRLDDPMIDPARRFPWA